MQFSTFIAILLLPCVSSDKRCALFRADDYYATNVEETYITAGTFSFSEHTTISFDFLADPTNYNGVLFAMGNEGFSYQPDWLDKEEVRAMQYVVIEIIYGAIAVSIKAMNNYRQKEIEIYSTHPTVYHLDDAQWHHFQLTRVVHEWTVELDHEASVRSRASNSTHNLLLFAKDGYIGGRPEYKSKQYKGLIKDLVVNEQEIDLNGKTTQGLAEVRACSSRYVRNYVRDLQAQLWAGPNSMDGPNSYGGSSYQGGNGGNKHRGYGRGRNRVSLMDDGWPRR